MHKLGFIFLLKEDICYNLETSQDQPLGIYNMIMKQLKNMSNYKVIPVYESTFQSEQDRFDYVDRLISWNFMEMESE